MLSSILLPVLCFTSTADEPVFSGPQPGEKLTPFRITASAGEEGELDIIAKAQDKPIVLVFVHERTRPAFGLANLVMRLVSARGKEKVVGGIVFLDADPTATIDWMNRIQNYFPKDIYKGVSPDGLEGPGAYGLNRNVAVTVLVGKAGKVTANFALVQPGIEADGPKIFKAVAEVLGEDEIPTIADYSRTPGMRRSSGEGQNINLRPLLAPLIKKNATDQEVDAAAKKVEDFAAENPQARRQIGDTARRIIAADRLSSYGTKKCQEYLAKWAKEFQPPSPPDRASGDKRQR